MLIQAWQKNQKVERTSPGSRNQFKVTYWDGQEKWTDDYPGDGKGGRREKRLRERKQSRPSIKDAKGTLDAAVKKYVGGGEKDGLTAAVDNVIVHVGREVGREVIRGYLKDHKDGAEGKTKEAHEVIRERMLEKLRKKTSMDTRIEAVAGRIVANEVTDTIKAQIRHFLPSLQRAVRKVVNRPMVPVSVKEAGSDTVAFTFKGFREDGEHFEFAAGALVRYDAGADTYIFTPFINRDGEQFWGDESRDFYVEDFGDVSKVSFIFQRAMAKLPKRDMGTALRMGTIASRIVQAALAAEKRDITRVELARLLGGRRFGLRKVSFRGFGYGEAYTLKVEGIPGGNVIPKDVYEANKDVFAAVKQIKENYTWMGLPIISA